MSTVFPVDPYADIERASTAELLELITAAMEKPAQTFESHASIKQFKRLLDVWHARLRRHHAAGTLSVETEGINGAMSSDPRSARLCAEHSTMLGMLGRLCEQCYAVSSLSADEQELFVLSVLELVAIFRRHKAEEDLLYYQKIWRDIGGEG